MHGLECETVVWIIAQLRTLSHKSIRAVQTKWSNVLSEQYKILWSKQTTSHLGWRILAHLYRIEFKYRDQIVIISFTSLNNINKTTRDCDFDWNEWLRTKTTKSGTWTKEQELPFCHHHHRHLHLHQSICGGNIIEKLFWRCNWVGEMALEPQSQLNPVAYEGTSRKTSKLHVDCCSLQLLWLGRYFEIWARN